MTDSETYNDIRQYCDGRFRPHQGDDEAYINKLRKWMRYLLAITPGTPREEKKLARWRDRIAEDHDEKLRQIMTELVTKKYGMEITEEHAAYVAFKKPVNHHMAKEEH